MKRWREFVLGVIVCLAVFAPVIAPFDPMLTAPELQMQAPDSVHLFGTDFFGRDVLSRALYGGQRTLLIAMLATVVTVLPGLILGLAAGLGGNVVDGAISMLIQALLAIPHLVLALVIMTITGQGVVPLIAAMGLTQVAGYAQVIRAAVRGAYSSGYVEAAVSLGAGKGWITTQHILPAIRPTMLAYTGVVFSYVVLNGAALSFLGLGGEPGIPDWGVMLAEGRAAFRDAPWIGLVPGVAITITIYVVNSLADRMQRRDFKV